MTAGAVIRLRRPYRQHAIASTSWAAGKDSAPSLPPWLGTEIGALYSTTLHYTTDYVPPVTDRHA